MSDDLRDLLRFLFRFFGWFPTVLGAGAIALGTFYDLMDWRFGGAIRSWSWMWGLALLGLGLVTMSTGRRWMAALGVLACGCSAALVFWWERHIGALEEWSRIVYAADAVAIACGVAGIAYWTWRRPFDVPVKTEAP